MDQSSVRPCLGDFAIGLREIRPSCRSVSRPSSADVTGHGVDHRAFADRGGDAEPQVREDLHPCAVVAELIQGAGDDTSTDLPPIEASIMDTPGEGDFLVTWESELPLETVASNAFDPRMEANLVELGYIEGYERDWAFGVGHISHVAYEFADAEAAAEFQARISEFACVYANDAFAAPDGGIGLQLRYSEEPRVREQISWVVGARRNLVTVAPGDPPSRDVVLEIYARGRAAAAGADAP